MQIFYQLAKNTFRECLREPVFFLILLTALFSIGILPALMLFVFNRQLWMVLDNALAITLFSGFIAAALCATHCIRREMTNGAILLLLSKPVPRFTFVLAKVAGICAAIAVYAYICCIATMISGLAAVNSFDFDSVIMLVFFLLIAGSCVFGALRNYYSHVAFASNTIAALSLSFPIAAAILYYRSTAYLALVGGASRKGTGMNLFIPFTELLPALLLTLFALLLIAVIASALATRFAFLTNLILTLTIFLAGVVSGPYIKATFGSDSFTGILLGAVIPNWQFFWMSDAMSHGEIIPVSYLLLNFLYVLIYGAVCTLWAGVSFENSELAKDAGI